MKQNFQVSTIEVTATPERNRRCTITNVNRMICSQLYLQVEYEKRCRKERHRPPKLDYCRRIVKGHDELSRMAIQVSEVLPHVPRDVIFRDLGLIFFFFLNLFTIWKP